MQCCDTAADADIFVAYVPGERTPLPAYQRDGTLIAQGGIGERSGRVVVWLEGLVRVGRVGYRGRCREMEDE